MKKYLPGQAFALNLQNTFQKNNDLKSGIADLVHIVYSINEKTKTLRFWTVKKYNGQLTFDYALQPIDIEAFDRLITRQNFICLTPEI